MSLTIRSNASQATPVTIDDVGVDIPAAGASATFNRMDDIMELQASYSLAGLLTDNAFGAGSSTLILVAPGPADVAQGNAITFLASVALPTSGPFSTLLRDTSARIPQFELASDPTSALQAATMAMAQQSAGAPMGPTASIVVPMGQARFLHDLTLADGVTLTVENGGVAVLT